MERKRASLFGRRSESRRREWCGRCRRVRGHVVRPTGHDGEVSADASFFTRQAMTSVLLPARSQ